MSYSVLNCDNYLHIIDEDAFPVLRLDDAQLRKISYTDGAVCSGCILKLACSHVYPTELLYQIAAYIQQRFAYLEIDWFTTFYHVEKTSYLSIAFEMKEMLEHNAIDSEEALILRIAEFENNECVEYIDAIILKIAMMNIINFNVQVR